MNQESVKDTATVHESVQKILYQKIVAEGLDAEKATDQVIVDFELAFGPITDQGLVDKLFGLVRPLIMDKAKRIYRNHTRALENKVFLDTPLVIRRIDMVSGQIIDLDDEPVDWAEAQKQLIRRKFNLPNGRWVTYEDSSPEDHEQRAKWQRGRAGSILEDAQRHEKLAQVMRANDVDRLGDLDADLWRNILKP